MAATPGRAAPRALSALAVLLAWTLGPLRADASSTVYLPAVGHGQAVRRLELHAGGPIRALATQGNQILAAVGSGLLTYELPPGMPGAAPVLVGQLGPWPGTPRDIDWWGDRALISVGGVGLVVADFSVPSAPRILGTLPLAAPLAARVAGTHTAVVADRYSGLVIVNVTDPEAPAALARLQLDDGCSPSSLATAGDLAFVGTDECGLFVADVGAPTAPRIIGRWQDWRRQHQQPVRAVLADGDLLFVLWAQQLTILSVADPRHPSELAGGWRGKPDEFFSGTALAKDGPLLYLGGFFEGSVANHDTHDLVAVIDVADPAQPLLVGLYPVGREGMDPTALAASHSRLLVGVGAHRLELVDVSAAGEPTSAHRIAFPGSGDGLAVQGSTAYVVGADTGLQVYDMRSRGDRPALRGVLSLPGSPRSVQVAGSKAYVAAGHAGLLAVDVLDPANPRLVGQTRTGGPATVVAVAGNKAVVAVGPDPDPASPAPSAGLKVFDLSVPSVPRLVESIGGFGRPDDLAGTGSIVLVLEGQTLTMYEAGGPRLRRLSRFIPPARPPGTGPWVLSSLAAVDGAAYLAGSGGIVVVDLRDPAHPVYLGGMESCTQCRMHFGPEALAVVDDTLFLAVDVSRGSMASDGGIGVYSLASLPALDPSGSLPWPFEDTAAHDLVPAPERLLAATDQGLLVFAVR